MPNDPKKVVRSNAIRKDMQEKIKEALAKKPTASAIARQGISAQALTKMMSQQPDKSQPQKQRIVRNGKNRNRTQRPASVHRQSSSLNLIVTEPAPLPYNYIYQTPWSTSQKADVSIIIPLYKSQQVVKDQISKWTTDEGLNVEIIYVDDCCPLDSKAAVVKAWAGQKPQAMVVCNHHNVGFGRACNVAVKYATGDFLIFLNADTTVTPNWIKPMLRLFDDPKVGIVGNLHIKDGGGLDGTVDSAGSEWSWQSLSFEHVGRNLLNGYRLDNPLRPETVPPELKIPAEREMVTGCCIMMRKSLFERIGGFDHNYRVGYWEDSELCCVVREMGYKVMYQPESVIHHKLSHSGAGAHQFQQYNAEYFRNKWVYSGRIDDIILRGRPGGKPKLTSILVNRFGANGDVLLASAILPALRKRHPAAQITFTTACVGMLHRNPYLHEVLRHDHSVKLSHYQYIVNLDLAYEYHPKTHILDAYAMMAGVDRSECVPFIYTQQPKVELPNKYAVVHVKNEEGFTWVGRFWKNDRFADVVNKLRNSGLKVICIGSHTDAPMPADMDVRGKTSISELAYIIQHASLFVGMDSMPMHIAQIFNVPGVAFFGSVMPKYRLFSPKMVAVAATHLDCIGCHHRKLPPCVGTHECERHDVACESELTVDHFWNAIEDVLSGKTIIPVV